jgi:hypothetical protein
MITNEDALSFASVIKNKTHSEEEMRKRYDVPNELGFTTFVLVDSSVLASKLSTCIETIEFIRRTEKSMTLQADAASSAPCAGLPRCAGTPRLDATVALQDAPSLQEAKREDEPAKHEPATQAKGAGGGQHDEPSGHGQTDSPSKKQRVLRELQELVNRIKQAAKAGLFVSSDAARSDTVLFWCKQTVQTLQTTTAGGKTEFTKNFPQCLAKILMENPVYKHLEQFTTIFNDLPVLGCPSSTLINAVMAVAKINADAGGDLDLGTDCDLKLRLRFFDSVLYKDFQEQRVAGLLTAAKGALERPKRNQLLDALDSVVDTSSDEIIKKQICWARTLFAKTLTERQRLM